MLIIDRIEGQWAIIEMEDVLFKLPLALLPKGAKEGDLLTLQIALLPDEQKQRKASINDLMDELF